MPDMPAMLASEQDCSRLSSTCTDQALNLDLLYGHCPAPPQHQLLSSMQSKRL